MLVTQQIVKLLKSQFVSLMDQLNQGHLIEGVDIVDCASKISK